MRISNNNNVSPFVLCKIIKTYFCKRKLWTAVKLCYNNTIFYKKSRYHRFRRNYIKLKNKNLEKKNTKNCLNKLINPIKNFK